RLPWSSKPKTFCSRLPGDCDFPGISAELVRNCEITANFHRCKFFFSFFANFCKRGVWYGGNEGRALVASTETTARAQTARFPFLQRETPHARKSASSPTPASEIEK